MCTNRLENIREKFWEKYVDGFLIYGLRVKLIRPEQSMHKRTGSNGVNYFCKTLSL